MLRCNIPCHLCHHCVGVCMRSRVYRSGRRVAGLLLGSATIAMAAVSPSVAQVLAQAPAQPLTLAQQQPALETETVLSTGSLIHGAQTVGGPPTTLGEEE